MRGTPATASISGVRGFFPRPPGDLLSSPTRTISTDVPITHRSRLHALAQHLPFAVDDSKAAADAFSEWRSSGDEENYRVSVLWAYCFVTRYFAVQFARERVTFASDYDAAVGRAIDRVVGSMSEVRDPARFPGYVSVVCRRVLLTHRSRYREAVEVEDDDLRVPDPSFVPHDRALVRAMLEEAVDRLAPAIGEVARMRLLEGRSYQDIAAALGRPIDSVRTYQSKALRALRADPGLRSLWFDGERAEVDEPSVEAAGEVRSGPPPGL